MHALGGNIGRFKDFLVTHNDGETGACSNETGIISIS